MKYYLSFERNSVIRGVTAAVLATLCFSAMVGCGKSTAQVSGVVTWSDGKPLEGEIRVIRFEPTAHSTAEVHKAAFADIAEDGKFEMMTRVSGDGVLCGQYKVTFTILKTALGRESAIPAKYTSADESPFEIDVQSDISDLTYQIERP